MKTLDNLDYEYLLNLYGDNVIASMTDLEGKIIFASHAYEVISGYSNEELIGQSHNIVRHPDMPASAFEDLWTTIQSGKVWVGDVLNRKKDGGSYWVTATITPQKDKAGNIIGYASIRENITLKKEMEVLHSQVTTMLDNIDDGFLIFDKDMKVNESYSKRCLEILSQDDITNKNISQLLFSNDSKAKSLFDYSYSEILKSDVSLTRELLLSLLPAEHYHGKNIFTIKYKLLPDDKCLVLLLDVTKQRELEKDIIHEQEVQKMIIAIASNKQESIDLKYDFQDFLDDLYNILDATNNLEDNLAQVRRKLHTYKGLFAQKEMIHLSEAIHQVEADLETHIKDNKHDIKKISEILKFNLEMAFACDIKMIDDVLGEGFLDSKSTVSVRTDKIEFAKEQIVKLMNKSRGENKEKLRNILNSVSSMVDQPFINMLMMYPNMLKTLAIQLDKKLLPLKIIGDENLFVSSCYKPFTDSLVHIFRNSIDHGIENSMEREQSNKLANGLITCEYKRIDDDIILTISDDGKGLDANILANKALEKKIITQEELSTMDNQTILKLIFANDFSTSEDITTLSGRGVGLDAVMYELEKLDGSVNIVNKIGSGVSFIFTIPYKQTNQVEEIEQSDESVILDCVIDVSKSFLENDMSLEVKNTKNFDGDCFKDNFSTVSFKGNLNLFCIVSMDANLTNNIYNIFLPDLKSEDKTIEMLNSLLNEVVNIVAGLAISKFPVEYKDLVLSEPIAMDSSILESLKLVNSHISKEIQTVQGNLICTIINLKD